MTALLPEVWTRRGRAGPTPFPQSCPNCGAPPTGAVNSPADPPRRRWINYQCGANYRAKPQTQNHTDKWWGACPAKEEDVPHRYVVAGREVVLCAEHKKLVETTTDLGREVGVGNWKCAVCTMRRRMEGGLAEPVISFVDGWPVTRYPSGVVMCGCPSWRFQRLPPAQRSCKHTEATRSKAARD